MSVDTIGNFLTAIRNAVSRSRRSICVPYSRMKHQIAEILKREGFIRDVIVQQRDSGKTELCLSLKYVDGESVIHEITRASRPGRRLYEGVSQMEHVVGGLGIAILTTSQGVITDKEARQRVVGGEVLCTVW